MILEKIDACLSGMKFRYIWMFFALVASVAVGCEISIPYGIATMVLCLSAISYVSKFLKAYVTCQYADIEGLGDNTRMGVWHVLSVLGLVVYLLIWLLICTLERRFYSMYFVETLQTPYALACATFIFHWPLAFSVKFIRYWAEGDD